MANVIIKCKECIWEGNENELLNGNLVEYNAQECPEKIIGNYKACPMCRAKIDID